MLKLLNEALLFDSYEGYRSKCHYLDFDFSLGKLSLLRSELLTEKHRIVRRDEMGSTNVLHSLKHA